MTKPLVVDMVESLRAVRASLQTRSRVEVDEEPAGLLDLIRAEVHRVRVRQASLLHRCQVVRVPETWLLVAAVSRT